MWANQDIRVIDLDNPRQTTEIKDFLRQFSLTFDQSVEFTIALYIDNCIAGVGSFAGKILRNIAVMPQYQGDGLTATIVSYLMGELARRGIFHYFIFTKPDKVILFEGLGFREIARAEPYAALLEGGMQSIEAYCRQVNDAAKHLPAGRRAGLVVNCNPFTLGHRSLILRAAQENDSVIVFVVSEDRSLFPFSVRIRLVIEGVADLPNVVVVPAGEYSVSQATFPAYFTRAEEVPQAQTRIDATIFAARIAPATGIKVRYAGEEPYCPVTAQYNQVMAEVLPSLGVEFKVITRFAVADDYVSASKVREMLKDDRWEDIIRVVPETTYRFLQSDAAKPIIEKIKQSASRH